VLASQFVITEFCSSWLCHSEERNDEESLESLLKCDSIGISHSRWSLEMTLSLEFIQPARILNHDLVPQVGWNIPYPGGYSPTGETGWLARTD
jgi:hypothetical protein